MAISKAKVGESQERLMLAIGEAIRIHTTQSPMTLETIVGTLGFCTGAAIGKGSNSRKMKRDFREMAVANVDLGIEAMQSSMANTSLILPESMQ
jgi:hypothetical protein